MGHLVKSLHDCMVNCEYTLTYCLNRGDVHTRGLQIQLLRDCIDICVLCEKYAARNSHFTKSLCHLCAYVCEACGNECLRHSDSESQMCGHMCLKCAEECRAMAK